MIRLFVCLFVYLFVSSASFARENQDPPVFNLQSVTVSQVVSLYFQEVAKRPYLVCSDVLADARSVSIRAQGKDLDAAMLGVMLDEHGYEARTESGVVVVCKKREAKEPEDLEPFVYRPRFRDTAYLVDILSPLIKGTFANKRTTTISTAVGKPDDKTGQQPMQPLTPQSSGAQSMNPGKGDDYIVFSGQAKELERLKKLLPQLDVATGEVMVKGYLYEVGKNDTEGSALNMVLSVLKGRLGLSVGGDVLGNALTIKTGNLDFVASALNADSRFKIVTSPFTRVRSGATARLQVGQDVPILGSIVTNANGQAQQSVDYKQSGVIIEVTPKVREGATDLDLVQTVSDFVQTETGLSSTPTLNKREIRTSLAAKDGEVLVIGGLNQSKAEDAKSGLSWLPFSLSKTHGNRSSELVLILELKKL